MDSLSVPGLLVLGRFLSKSLFPILVVVSTMKNVQERQYLLCCVDFSKLKDGDYFCFDDIIAKIKELPNPEREMRKEVITLCKLILVNPAISAASERSFSTARGLKTWLRSRMNQEQFSNLTVFNIHKERTDVE